MKHGTLFIYCTCGTASFLYLLDCWHLPFASRQKRQSLDQRIEPVPFNRFLTSLEDKTLVLHRKRDVDHLVNKLYLRIFYRFLTPPDDGAWPNIIIGTSTTPNDLHLLAQPTCLPTSRPPPLPPSISDAVKSCFASQNVRLLVLFFLQFASLSPFSHTNRTLASPCHHLVVDAQTYKASASQEKPLPSQRLTKTTEGSLTSTDEGRSQPLHPHELHIATALHPILIRIQICLIKHQLPTLTRLPRTQYSLFPRTQTQRASSNDAAHLLTSATRKKPPSTIFNLSNTVTKYIFVDFIVTKLLRLPTISNIANSRFPLTQNQIANPALHTAPRYPTGAASTATPLVPVVVHRIPHVYCFIHLHVKPSPKDFTLTVHQCRTTSSPPPSTNPTSRPCKTGDQKQNLAENTLPLAKWHGSSNALENLNTLSHAQAQVPQDSLESTWKTPLF